MGGMKRQVWRPRESVRRHVRDTRWHWGAAGGKGASKGRCECSVGYCVGGERCAWERLGGSWRYVGSVQQLHGGHMGWIRGSVGGRCGVGLLHRGALVRRTRELGDATGARVCELGAVGHTLSFERRSGLLQCSPPRAWQTLLTIAAAFLSRVGWKRSSKCELQRTLQEQRYVRSSKAPS